MRMFGVVVCMASLVFIGELAALDLARPYEASLAVSYGYDNSDGSGCTDYECGSVCYSGHAGSDFPLVLGTEVLAGADGTVSAVHNGCSDWGYLGNTCGGRCGNYVRIEHPNGDSTVYCHLQNNSLTVSTGDTVSCGEVIGRSASSGSSTGPHLHLGWRPGGGPSTDVYAGSCNSSPGAWAQQNAYGEAPSGDCGCTASGEVCDGTDSNCDGEVDSGDVCEVDLLHQAPQAYTRTHTTDIDGDGRQEICGRFYHGFRCFGFDGTDWNEKISPSFMGEDDGWGEPQYYSTIRMGDIDGDGRADVCARFSDGFTCWLSTGDGFEKFDTIPWTDHEGWDRPEYYTTIRLADITGNGRHDVCARGASGWHCYLSTPDGFGQRIDGPEWSDANGYDRARYYGTIRVGDIDGDGYDDVCIRGPEGFQCFRASTEGFEGGGVGFQYLTTEEDLADEHGWDNVIYWHTLRLADIDGDGTLALCGRNANRLFCQRFNGSTFGERIHFGNLSNDSGWSDPTNYATLRVGDVSGDGSDDLCIRANAGMRCYRVDGDEVTRWDGPEWSNARGWDAPASHGPLFVTDLDAQGPGALCSRATDGLTCKQYGGGGFVDLPKFHQFTDDGSWTRRRYYSTLRMGTGVCPESVCGEEEEVEEEEEEVKEEEEPNVPIEDDDPIEEEEPPFSSDDVGVSEDTGTAGPSQNYTVSDDSSCATVASGQSGGTAWLFFVGLFGLWWCRRKRSRLVAMLSLLTLGTFGLLGCDGPVPDTESVSPDHTTQAQATTLATETKAPVGRPAPVDEDHDLLAIHGDWRVYGEALSRPHGTDGPLQYQPTLVQQGTEKEWPLDSEIISEALLVGDGPTLFALKPNGTLLSLPLDTPAEPTVIDRNISSQITASVDGCCVAYIRDSFDQTLHVHHLQRGELYMVLLGYSLGWAPALSPGGEEVAWTASPMGYASILVSYEDAEEPRIIVNAEENLDVDQLAPYPTGIHLPIWSEEGIAFEDDSHLWLIDESGQFIGMADAGDGMFWDEVQGKLVNRFGNAIDWKSPPSQHRR